MKTNRRFDAIVVGAGLAGLAAAERLQAAGKRALVIEAADEVGGRTRSRVIDGEIADFGGEWIGRGHRRMIVLLRSLGIPTRPARQIGRPILWRGPSGRRLLIPRLSARELAAVPRVLRAAASQSRRIDPDQPWSSADATRIDGMSVGQWLRSLGVDDEGYYFFDKVIGGLSSTPIDRLSLLQLLWWIRRGGGPLRAVSTTFERNIPTGAQSVAHGLARRLEEPVMLGAQVTAISQGHAVEVRTDADESVVGERVILTAPIGMLGRIEFDPPLPAELAALDELSIDPGTKIIAHLPQDKLPIHRVFVGGDVLAGGWRTGAKVTGFAPPPLSEAPSDRLLADLARGFAVTATELGEPSVYRWSEHPHIPGCDIGFAPGQLTIHGPNLRRAHGLVHFAGTERSSWPNNMEGAVESGQRAALETIASLTA